jgi:hypothetical protein
MERPTKTMVARCFLATFRPLVRTAKGRRAARLHNLPPFIDGSCRREPDFESRFPSITAACRAGNFAPRLRVGDRVAYLTVKGRYGGDQSPGWRLIAVLRVTHRFTDHVEAAKWYARQNCPPPSNCFVDDNPPNSFERTNGRPPAIVRRRVSAQSDFHLAIRLWDATYRIRITKWPVFLSTKVEFLELTNPPQLREADFVKVFSKVPGTRNPPAISLGRLKRLVALANRRRKRCGRGT